MHEVSLTADLLAQIQSQRGKLHPFERLDMRRTAHVVVDLQNGFMEPGAPVEVPVAREIVPNVNSISAAVRRGGGRNVFLRMTVDSDSRSRWSNWFAHMHTPQGGAAVADAFARNAHYWQLWPQLEVAATDQIIEKMRFGAFVPGASGLHELLQAQDVDTLIITGTLTNCCCESTARDAMQMNYKVVFVSDATAALTDAAHAATLENMALLFADVMTTGEVIAAVGRAVPTTPP
ncbi:MAG TPA: cysteine hydrolase [Steroidobacteraceae bacterium]|nr:cysteine hydrolase [Steroidobacteraceae bacterium]